MLMLRSVQCDFEDTLIPLDIGISGVGSSRNGASVPWPSTAESRPETEAQLFSLGTTEP